MNHKDKHYFYTQLHLTVFAINFHLLYYPNLFYSKSICSASIFSFRKTEAEDENFSTDSVVR